MDRYFAGLWSLSEASIAQSVQHGRDQAHTEIWVFFQPAFCVKESLKDHDRQWLYHLVFYCQIKRHSLQIYP